MSLQHLILSGKNFGVKECAHRDANFQEELESLKASVARLTSLLEHILRMAFGEGPSNQPTIFVQP